MCFVQFVLINHLWLCNTVSLYLLHYINNLQRPFFPKRTITPTAGCEYIWVCWCMCMCMCGVVRKCITRIFFYHSHSHVNWSNNRFFPQVCVHSGVCHWPVCRISQVGFHRWSQGGQLWSASPLSCWKVKVDMRKTPILAPLQSPADFDTHQADIEPVLAGRAVV